MKASISLFVSLFFILNFTQAQDYFILQGKVIDAKTEQPLAYAHVGIPKKGIGTTSSDQGDFKFKVPNNQKDAVLTVSFIGYDTYSKIIRDLEEPLVIRIQPIPTNITEIEVLTSNAVEDIVRKAVKRIPKNYPTYSHTDLAFYRESRTGRDSQYIYLAEGVLNVYKKSYKSKKEGQVSLVQGRKINLKNPLDTTISGGFSSGHMAAHRFDFVFNREDFLQEKYFPVYDYWIEGMTSYNGNPVYIIAFNKDYDASPIVEKRKKKLFSFDKGRINFNGKGKNRIIKARMKGKIYIDKKTFAIIRGEFEVTKEGLKKWNNYPLYSGNWKGNSYIVNYQQLGDKWFFSDAFRKGKYGGGGVYTNEVKITEINPKKSSPIPYLDRMTRNQRFTRMTGSYDPDFWQSYNTTPLNAALTASVEQLQNAKKATEALDPIYLAELQLRRDSIEYVKRQRELEDEKEEIDFDMSGMQPSDWRGEVARQRGKRKKKRKKSFNRFSTYLGLGTHFIPVKSNPLTVTILTDEEPRETILTISDEIEARDLEVIGTIDMDFYFQKNFFMRMGSSFDFWNSKYRERSIGVGTQFNLSRQRPFFVRATAEYSNLKYYRKLGVTDNDYGKFKIDGDKFKANNIKVAYGSRTHNLKLSAEMSIELNPAREFYIRGTYFMPFSRRQDVWLQERKELFRKDTKVPVSDSRVKASQNDMPFAEQIMPDETISITIGWAFK